MEVGDATGNYAHPILDRIRQHSTNPEEACDFFIQLLRMNPEERHNRDYLSHPYLAQQRAKMQDMLAARDLKSKQVRPYQRTQSDGVPCYMRISQFELLLISCGAAAAC